MEKLNAILVDDEKDSLELLEYQLSKNCPFVNIQDKCTSAKEALTSIKRSEPDVIFLDINMPHISGLELAEMMPKGNHEIIFITAFEHYAVKAFKTCAVDYLLKPIATDDLIAAVNKIKNKQHSQWDNKLEFLSQQMVAIKNKNVKKIMLPTINGMTFIYLSEIVHCESVENYSNIFLANDEKIFVTKPLKFLEEILQDYEFMRIHKSFIVNLNRIKTYNKTDGGHLIMENDTKINISRTKKEQFISYIQKNI